MLERVARLLAGPFRLVIGQRGLIAAMARRELAARYRGSVLGGLWVVLAPLLMLAVYTFVFGLVFRVRWGDGEQSTGMFTAALFCGVTAYGLFADVLNRAPLLVVGNANYVKKVVFPLEILGIVNVLVATVNFAIGVAILLVFLAVSGLGVPLTVLALPLLLLPYVLLLLGVSWFLAALGVYLRDVSQMTGLVATAMLFLSPVFYPASAVPPAFRTLFYLNPMTYLVESFRNLLVFGQLPSPGGYAIYLLCAFGMMWLGYAWFRRLRHGFADVL